MNSEPRTTSPRIPIMLTEREERAINRVLMLRNCVLIVIGVGAAVLAFLLAMCGAR